MTDKETKEINIIPDTAYRRINALFNLFLYVGGSFFIFIGATGIAIIIYFLWKTEPLQTFEEKSINAIIADTVSWLVLFAISYMSVLSIKEIFDSNSGDMLRRRANYIAIIVALVLTIFLFKQPFLDQFFGGDDIENWVKLALFGGGVTGGWIVWSLRHLRRYGEFFNVFLMAAVTGFCWYARLTAPEEIQLTAVAFLLGSLFRIAKDNLDQAAKRDSRTTPPTQ